MPPLDANQGLIPSIVDRLVDPVSAGTDARRGYSLSQMLEVIRRDLEDLLNTRQSIVDLPPELKHVNDSMAMFGLPDLTSFNVTTPQQKSEMSDQIEKIVKRHEPRLRDVTVRLVESEEGNRHTFRCRIDGRLALDPAPEVCFDTVMEPLTGQHKVRAAEK